MPNRLARETSPYLLQHKNNPVDWYPWGDEALDRARSEKKPILLSVGYSACHWCHVMEHESFENRDTAALMNHHYVCIKVDREERPDLDHLYQNVAQAMTRSGGWPLTVFLTPELKPFFGGTYFPPEDRYGRPGFPRVLQALAEAYKSDPEGIAENARRLTEYIAKVEEIPSLPPTGAEVRYEALEAAAENLGSLVDWVEGGFGTAPKFPNTMGISYLWRWGMAAGHPQSLEAALLSLRKMASGGIYDQLGGGFHRYSVDGTWSVPHFEKMLYDNALLLKLYGEVLSTGRDRLTEDNRELFTRVLEETVSYVEREMTTADGAFYSAQDADSEGVEGKYFVWDPKELEAELSADEARIFALRYGVSAEGNFEHGKTVLYLAKTIAEVSGQSGFPAEKVKSLLEGASLKLLAARDRRVKPGLDNKVLTSWNGLMISGLVWASKGLGDSEKSRRAAQMAKRAFEFLCSQVTDGDRLFSSFQGGKAKNKGYLDDYAFLARAALDLTRIEESAAKLEELERRSKAWVDAILKHFKGSGPGYFFVADDHEALLQRPKTVFDQAIPAGSAVALECLLALMEINPLECASYEKEYEQQILALFPLGVNQPFGMGELLCIALTQIQGPVVVSGPQASRLCSHPAIFQKPLDPQAPRDQYLICHQRTCSRPIATLDATRAEILARLSQFRERR